MAWSVSVNLDPDSSDVGTISATWTEAAGTFTYSSRAKKDTGGIASFAAAAKNARNAWQAKATENTAGADEILAKLNQIDPQA